MFNWFAKRRQAEIQQAARKIIEEERAKEAAAKEAEEKRQRALVEAALEAKRLEEEQMKNSDEPWVKLQSTAVDKDGRISMALDWNDAFVAYLRQECKFEGDGERIVQQWLGALMREIYGDSKNEALNILKLPEFEEPSQ